MTVTIDPLEVASDHHGHCLTHIGIVVTIDKGISLKIDQIRKIRKRRGREEELVEGSPQATTSLFMVASVCNDHRDPQLGWQWPSGEASTSASSRPLQTSNFLYFYVFPFLFYFI